MNISTKMATLCGSKIFRRKYWMIFFWIVSGSVQLAFSQITVFPYGQDFESGPDGWTVDNASDVNGWELGTPANGFIGSAHSGDNAWKTNLDGRYSSSTTIYLISPEFDFTSLTSDPYISFYINYELHPNDFGVLEFSTDGGGSWNALGSNSSGGLNWYSDPAGWANRPASNFIQWTPAGHILTGLAGVPSVFLRFKLTAVPSSSSGEGIAIDDIAIRPNGPDLAITHTEFPSGMELGASERIVATINNTLFSVLSATDLSVSLTVSGPLNYVRQENLSGVDIAPGNTATVEFENLDFSMPGVYRVDVEVIGPGDPFDFNNISAQAVFQKTINTFPYFQNFESDPGGFSALEYVFNASNDGAGRWKYGTPAGTTISSAYSGTKAWTTNLEGPYALDAFYELYSPRYDLSSFTKDPFISVYANYDIDFSNSIAFIEYSTDGLSWSLLGSPGSGYNWYDFSGGPSAGNSGGWISTALELTGLAGESSVVFRVNLATFPGTAGTNEGFSIDDLIIGNLVADAGDNQAVCYTTTVNLSANQPLFGTGRWSVVSGTGGIFADVHNPQTTFTGNAGETYQLNWTISVGGAIADVVDSTFVELRNPVMASAGNDQSTCNSSVLLAANADAGSSGVWTIESGAGGTISNPSDPSSSFSGVTGQTYILKWTFTINSCQSTDEVSIALLPTPIANAGNDLTTCNASVTLSANTPGASSSGVWTIESGAGGIVSNPGNPSSSFSGVTGQTYILKWTLATNGCQSTDDVSIALLSAPIANAGNDLSACNASVTLSANAADANGSGEWTIESGAGGIISNPGNPSSSFSGTPGENYVLKWTLTTNGCQSGDEVNITLTASPPKPTITIEGSGNSQSLIAHPVADTYHWFRNSQPVAGSGQTLVIQENGSYTVQVTLNGCLSPLSDPVDIDLVTGLPEIYVHGISAYPNPFRHKLFVKLNSTPADRVVTLMNTRGSVVQKYQTTDKENLEIDASGIDDGVYLLSIVTGKREIFLKVVKVK